MKENLFVSEPRITIAAKGFLKDPPETAAYLKAVSDTVSGVVRAIEERIEDNATKKPQDYLD